MAEGLIFQVSEFNEFISAFLGKIGEVIVEGEISECNVSHGKWIFLRIKDEKASVEVFGVTTQISGYSILEAGMLVHVYGTPRLYSKTGKFDVYAHQIVPAGEGALKLAFDKLKQKLEKEGLFAQQRKRLIPKFPEKIGLITAKDSSAYGDFVKILTHRMGGLKIFLYPVNVQGQGSVESIVRAFGYFNNKLPDLDAVAIVRGGGSLEDLQSFNDESVARAIFGSKFPVICGVGHEDDITIADLVSDLRASTPSNAAELLVGDRIEALSKIDHNASTIYNILMGILKDNNIRIMRNVQTLENAISQQTSIIHKLIARYINQFLLLRQEARNLDRNRINLQERIGKGLDYWVRQRNTEADNLIRLFRSFDTRNVLKRGFSITFDENGKSLKTTEHLTEGSRITTRLFDGKIGSRVLVVTRK